VRLVPERRDPYHKKRHHAAALSRLHDAGFLPPLRLGLHIHHYDWTEEYAAMWAGQEIKGESKVIRLITPKVSCSGTRGWQ